MFLCSSLSLQRQCAATNISYRQPQIYSDDSENSTETRFPEKRGFWFQFVVFGSGCESFDCFLNSVISAPSASSVEQVRTTKIGPDDKITLIQNKNVPNSSEVFET